MDGAIMRADGTMIRAATNCKVGSMGDMMIHASATLQKPDGTWTEPKAGKVRFGTRIILPDGRHMSFMEMAASEGWRVSDDGYMVGMMKGEDGELQEQKFLFPYAHGEELPKPEAYILARSAVTLEEIYASRGMGTNRHALACACWHGWPQHQPDQHAFTAVKATAEHSTRFCQSPGRASIECTTRRAACHEPQATQGHGSQNPQSGQDAQTGGELIHERSRQRRSGRRRGAPGL